MKNIEISGKVFTGKGTGAKFITLQWVRTQIEAKAGFTPYAGTLNIRLSDKNAARRKVLETTETMSIRPAEGYCNGKLFKATISTVNCAVVIPEVAGYPHNVLEIIASINLRQQLQLSDGDEVTVTVHT